MTVDLAAGLLAEKHQAEEAYLRRLVSDYPFFLQELWKDRNLNKVAPLGEVELDIARFLAGTDPAWGPFREAMAPRGIGKTHFGPCALTCFRLLRDRDRRIVNISKTGGAAADSNTLIRSWIETVWFLRHLTPSKRAGNRDNSDCFDVRGSKENRQPSVKCLGIDGQLPSNRAHSVFPDDVETDENTKTKQARDGLEASCREFKRWLYADSDKDDLPLCIDPIEVAAVGTYQHEDSLYIRWAKPAVAGGQPAYVRRVWPLCFPREGDRIDDLAPLIAGKLASGEARYSKDETDFVNNCTLPYRYGRKYVAEKLSDGLHPFLQQYQLLSTLANVERYPLRLQDLIVFSLPDDPVGPTGITWGKANQDGSTAVEIDSIGHGDDRLYGPIFVRSDGSSRSEFAPYTGTCMWIDAAGGGKGDSTDSTGIAIVSHLAGNLFCRYLGATVGGHTQDIYHQWAGLAKKYRVTHVCIEHNASRGLLNQAMTPILAEHRVKPGEDPKYPEGWHAVIVDDSKLMHSYGMKEERIIATLQPILGDHRLVVTPDVAANEKFQWQLTRIQAQKGCLGHDDEIDALAGACRFWEFSLRQDRTKATQRVVEAKRRQSLIDEIRQQMGGKAPQKKSVLRRLF